MKNVKREYQPRGTRRGYKTLRVDPDTHEILQKLVDTWGISFLQVVEKLAKDAVKKLPTTQPNEVE